MSLTKTDFIQFLNCPQSIWLKKNIPEKYPEGKFSLFVKKLINEGYEVEEYAKMLFSNAINLPENANPEKTLEALKSDHLTFFQPSFKTTKGAFARIDVLEKLPDGSYHIYEIKSSTKISVSKKHNHLKDACFQTYVLKECGYSVSKVSIIYLNKNYVKSGKIEAKELLKIEDITNEIENIYSIVVNEINDGINFINKETINLDQCSCRFKTRTNHCDSFYYFNKDILKYSIYEIGRISEKKINSLINNNCTKILDINDEIDLNNNQKLQVESLKKGDAIINNEKVKQSLEGLKFPLHFIDYETYASAVPKIDKLSPHKHLVFQVSIHTLKKNGERSHFEWLGKKMELPHHMLSKMHEFTGTKGTFISWHSSFEIGRNKDMLNWLPDFDTYLNYINKHMFDLEDIFKKDIYIDFKFHGSSSIKKVLPVLCKKFSYLDLEIQDGTMALDTWGRMMTDLNFNENIDKTRKNLLAYCKYDTLAMVEIYSVLRNRILNNKKIQKI